MISIESSFPKWSDRVRFCKDFDEIYICFRACKHDMAEIENSNMLLNYGLVPIDANYGFSM